MNILEILNDAIKPFLDREKPPLHVGEVMNLWFYLTATEQTMVGEQISFNTVLDEELREKLQVVLNDVHRPIHKELSEFLIAEGVRLPGPGAEKAVGDFRTVPEDAKLNDKEVANLLSFNIVLGINYACRGYTESVRPDVAAMFARYQMKKMAFGVTLRDMMMRKGWLQIPPYHPPAALIR